jgi:hypothetical protein
VCAGTLVFAGSLAKNGLAAGAFGVTVSAAMKTLPAKAKSADSRRARIGDAFLNCLPLANDVETGLKKKASPTK